MASSSLCRSAARSLLLARSKSLTQKSMPSLFPSPTRTSPCISRIAMALGCVESLMPLHSAIASTRLISNIAVDSSCWSLLSRALVVDMAVNVMIIFLAVDILKSLFN